MSAMSYAQDFVREEDKKTGKVLLRGRLTFQDVMEETVNKWLLKGAESYRANEVVTNALKGVHAHYRLVIFMGTWCSDSQREVPRFYKILDQLGISEKRVVIIAVDDHPDRRKTSPGGEEKGKNIEYVPTFIVKKDGVELGRIIESPQRSLEADMAGFLSK